MVVKLYISGISGNKEVKKKQQRVQMILDSKQITYEAIDITEPGKEKDKEFMQQYGKVRESLGKHPLPPQIFNDENFCGDYEDFDLANEVDELEKFLHIETKDLENGSKVNGIQEDIIDVEKPERDEFNDKDGHKVNGKVDGDIGELSRIKIIAKIKVETNIYNIQSQTNEFEDHHMEKQEEDEMTNEKPNENVVNDVELGEIEASQDVQKVEEENEDRNEDNEEDPWAEKEQDE